MGNNEPVEVYSRRRYGVEYIYLVDEELAKEVSWVTKKRTLYRSDLKAFEKMGVVFKFVDL